MLRRYGIRVALFTAFAITATVRVAVAQGTLEGTVRDGAGQPVAGVGITLSALDLTGVTGAGGAYRIAGVPAGAHEVRFARIGYETQTLEVVVRAEGTLRVNVTLIEAAIALERLVVIGSRARPRTATQSMVPLDVVPVSELTSQGTPDLSSQLRRVLPSYNVADEPISDAATIARPVHIRNLAPDQTLVMVNGKRRHRSAVIVLWNGNGVADGAQGPDISTLPSIAMSRVEVLRDGASAQYGSDAIAGVINVVPKNNRSGGSVEVRGGRYQEGDGDMFTTAANVGLPLGETGFLSLSGEFGQSDPTSRSIQRNDAAALAAAGFPVRDPAQIWGSPEVDDNVKLFANTGYTFGGGVELYGFGSYHTKRVEGGFYFRNPNTRDAVFSIDGGETLLIGDVLDAQDGVVDGSANCPVVRIVNNVPDPVAMERVRSDPNCFSFQERFPGGFTPQFGGDAFDASAVGGIKGTTAGVEWDLSAGWGTHKIDFFMMNTVNASLGPETPTDFRPGINQQREFNLNLDLHYALGERTHVAGGFEHRVESFEIVPGDTASWELGPYLEQGFSAASNGFPGFGPLSEGRWDRRNVAVYGDAHHDGADDRWQAGLALRLEDFEDFGTTFNGKLSGRLRVAEGFALRSSASTGFRAPTPGQQNLQHIGTIYDITLMDLVNSGTIPPTSAVAQRRGGMQLQPETSVNLALGAALTQGPLIVTADYFRVSVSDRINLSPDYTLEPHEIEELIAEGVEGARNLARFRYYNNDFSTRSQGVDVVASYSPPTLNGNTTFSLLFNYTGTEVTEYAGEDPNRLSAGELPLRVRQLREALPTTRGSLSATHRAGRLRFFGKVGYFSGWYDWLDDHTYGGKALVDAEVAYTLANSVTLTVGAENLFNTFTDMNPGAAANVGNLYSQQSPFGFNGGLYYVRASYAFDW
ncbi:TonB-dependent receptor [Candidatus Palauibacter sp.]|uniref:TonB-dependent receptor n=1 Tax=Candidatus Palauibacter sp. TaxID=3101350 RepID=UPI003AF1F087